MRGDRGGKRFFFLLRLADRASMMIVCNSRRPLFLYFCGGGAGEERGTTGNRGDCEVLGVLGNAGVTFIVRVD